MLSLERLEDNLFRGQNRDIGTKYVFGGQILAQALAAAQNTIENSRIAHSLHAYFLRTGNIQQPIIYNVERTRDGKSFSLRRVYRDPARSSDLFLHGIIPGMRRRR